MQLISKRDRENLPTATFPEEERLMQSWLYKIDCIEKNELIIIGRWCEKVAKGNGHGHISRQSYRFSSTKIQKEGRRFPGHIYSHIFYDHSPATD